MHCILFTDPPVFSILGDGAAFCGFEDGDSGACLACAGVANKSASRMQNTGGVRE